MDTAIDSQWGNATLFRRPQPRSLASSAAPTERMGDSHRSSRVLSTPSARLPSQRPAVGHVDVRRGAAASQNASSVRGPKNATLRMTCSWLRRTVSTFRRPCPKDPPRRGGGSGLVASPVGLASLAPPAAEADRACHVTADAEEGQGTRFGHLSGYRSQGWPC